jgi:hypothetical protein
MICSKCQLETPEDRLLDGMCLFCREPEMQGTLFGLPVVVDQRQCERDEVEDKELDVTHTASPVHCEWHGAIGEEVKSLFTVTDDKGEFGLCAACFERWEGSDGPGPFDLGEATKDHGELIGFKRKDGEWIPPPPEKKLTLGPHSIPKPVAAPEAPFYVMTVGEEFDDESIHRLQVKWEQKHNSKLVVLCEGMTLEAPGAKAPFVCEELIGSLRVRFEAPTFAGIVQLMDDYSRRQKERQE